MIGLIADIHAANHKRHSGPTRGGINRRCRQVLDTLQAAVDRTKAEGCEALVVLGDLFDTTNPPQQIVAEVQRILGQVRTYVLLGNHDQVSTASGDHALGPLAPVVEVITEPRWIAIGGVDCLFVPFRPGPAMDWLPEVMGACCDDAVHKEDATLFLHLGISDVRTPGYMQGHHDVVSDALLKELCVKYGFVAAFAGNWHTHKVLSRRPLICQIGALCPTGYDNSGLRGFGKLVFWGDDV